MKSKKNVPFRKLQLLKKQIISLSTMSQNKAFDGPTIDIPCLSHLPNSVCDDCLRANQ